MKVAYVVAFFSILLFILFVMHHRFTRRYGELICHFEKFEHGNASDNLFIKYGGLATVETVVDTAVTNLLADPTLAPVFSVVGTPNHRSGAQLKSLLDLQISTLLGGPFVYPARSFTRGVIVDGRSMKASHASLTITTAQFNTFVNILAGTLIQCGVAQADVNAIAPKLQSMVRDIVTVTTTTTTTQ